MLSTHSTGMDNAALQLGIVLLWQSFKEIRVDDAGHNIIVNDVNFACESERRPYNIIMIIRMYL